MELTKQRAKENLARLIKRFEREWSADRIKEYNEEATKTSFIQPLLKEVLGWNVNDRDEVSPEEKISKGRVDYGLKLEGKVKIFVEAKPPRADLRKYIEQAVGYGYNRKGVPFVLLTDFEGLKLFDVTVKPDARNPLKGLKIDLQWDQYLQQFDKLWLLSKESVLRGELDKLLRTKPKERLPVDKAILDDLKRWRESLAKDIFKNNTQLFHSGDPEKDADYLKEITQKILDRVIFMRFCEDRRLVHYRSLKELFEERADTVGTNTMIFLREEFKHYNIIFDSDLFRPQEWETDRFASLTTSLAVDFKVMREIIEDTYHPYQFDVISLEVLGNIYEQYLGYTIRLTDHQLKYELKPEVRKAGGVYYTPEYIVDYIVKNTVGKLLLELPPKKIKKLRILDPACGSGSFLIRAYEEMLNYYRQEKKQKSKSKEKQRELKLREKETEPHLTIHEKSRILREHIFGVDIDEQAVEVTKLSLMLKMLEGEYGLIPGRAILPMLDANIKCGNSLISGDTLELKKYFGEDWYKVKPFNWDEEFRKIMKVEGGFNAVIGNPPYVLLQDEFRDEKIIEFVRKKFVAASYKIDTYHLFIEQGVRLLKPAGQISLIVPSNFLTNNYLVPLRKFILDNTEIREINSIGGSVFEQSSVDTAVFLLEKSKKQESVKRATFRTWSVCKGFIEKTAETVFPQEELRRSTELLFKFSGSESVLDKIVSNSLPLSALATVNFGMQLRDRSIFVDDVIEIKSNRDRTRLTNKHKLCLTGKNVKRYFTEYLQLYCLEDFLAKTGGCWNLTIHHTRNKIIVRQIGEYPICSLDKEGRNCLNTMFMVVPTKEISSSFLLGILNSRLIHFYWNQRFYDQRETFPKIKGSYLLQLPIRVPDLTKPAKKAVYEQIDSLVDVMLSLNKKVQTAKGSKKEQIQRQIEKTDKEIDDLVYKLYGITEKERKIIEGVAV